MQPAGRSGRDLDPAERPKGLFRLFGVPVRLHITFILFFVFLVWAGLGEQSALGTAVYLAALFGSVLLHELGHALVARRYGIRTKEIVMFPIGGVAVLERPPKPREELWVALAGPAVNVLIGLALLAVLYANISYRQLEDAVRPTDDNLLFRIMIGNFALAAFNMLPAFPMDGGRVLRSVLTRFRKEEDATRVALNIGRLLAFTLGLFGLLNGQYLLVFIAFFVWVGAAQEGAASIGRVLTEGIPVRAAMVTDFRTLPHGSTVGDAAALLLATSQQDFPVVHGDQVIGLLGRNALVRAMAAQGTDGYVSGVMDRNYTAVPPDTNLAEMVPLLTPSGSCALVMLDGQLQGMLTSENLSEFLLLRRVGLDPSALRTA